MYTYQIVFKEHPLPLHKRGRQDSNPHQLDLQSKELPLPQGREVYQPLCQLSYFPSIILILIVIQPRGGKLRITNEELRIIPHRNIYKSFLP